MKKDKILKELLKEIAKDISLYLLNIEVDEIEIIDKELFKIEKREADLIFKSKNRIIQIEIQNNYHSKMHLRMLRYFSDLAYQFENYQIDQFVIYIGKENAKFKTEYKNNTCSYFYHFIDMKKVDCRLFLNSNNPHKIILSILCDFKDENKEDIIREILIKLKKLSKDEYEFSKNIEILEILSSNRNLENLIQKEINMLSQIKLEDIPIFKEGMEKGIKKGIEKGIEKGIKEGIKEGIKKGKVLMLKELGFKDDEIAKRLSLSLKEVKEILKDNK